MYDAKWSLWLWCGRTQSLERLSEELESKNRLIEKQRNELAERESKIRELERQLARLAAAGAGSPNTNAPPSPLSS